MAWEPQQAGLLQLAGLLNDYQQPGSNQAQILQQLDAFKAVPDFNNYLAYIFAKGDQLSVEVRQGAGLLLKNNLLHQYGALPEEYRTYIKDALVWVLAHPSRPLRHTVSTIASAIVITGGLPAWPQLVGAVSQCLQSSDEHACDGGLSTLYKIVEDQPAQLESPLPGQLGPDGKPATGNSVLVGSVLKLMQAPGVEVRALAIRVLNLLVREMPVALLNQLDTYLQGLFALAHDTAPSVRREVCVGLVQLLSIQPDKLQPFIYQVIEYMLASNEHDDEGVALESCEFWMGFCDAELEPELLRKFLPRLIPMLMKNMVFDEYDEEVQDAEAAETAAGQRREEKDSELKPFKLADRGGGGGEGEGGEGDAGGDDDDEVASRWNLRRCSAAALDRLSLVYGDELLPLLLPIVEQRLQEADWRARESAILALGAVAEGCHQGLQPYLEGMVSMMLPKLADARPMVRIITCWSLPRYSHWLLTAAEIGASKGAAPSATPLGSVLQGLLQHVLDHNKCVQDAALSGVAAVVEQSMNEGKPQLLHTFLKPILETLSMAMVRFTRRNLRLLYDTLDQLLEAMGRALVTPELLPLFLSPMVNRLVAYDVQDKDLLPLLDVLATILPKVGEAAAPYATPLLEKALKLCGLQLELLQQQPAQQAQQQPAGQPQPKVPTYDPDALVCALDMISGIVEALGPSVAALLAPTPMPAIVSQSCRSEQAGVRQSAFALVGDLAKSCPVLLQPVAADVVALALAYLDPQAMTQETLKSCNNACWALGEMALRLPPDMLQQSGMAERIAERTAGILLYRGRLTRSMLENAAITLGRVALVCPQQVAPHLAHFCGVWCSTLRSVRDDFEKEHAFLGLCAVVRLNPEPAVAAFPQVAGAVASWRQVTTAALSAEMLQLLQGLKQSLTASGQWPQAWGALDAALRNKLQQLYQL